MYQKMVPCKDCKKKQPNTMICVECRRCQPTEGAKCCRCTRCTACHDTLTSHNYGCGNCAACFYCCECARPASRPRGITHVSPPSVPFHNANKAQLKENRSRRFAAAEIEVAGIGGTGAATMEAMKRWRASIVSDGSLPQGGFEINTAPANGDLLLRQIRDITDALNREHDQGWVDQSCGLHVHIDARDFTYYDLRRLLILYSKIEDSLFDVVPGNRRSSDYCKKCAPAYLGTLEVNKTPSGTKAAIIHNYYGQYGDISGQRETKNGGRDRYRALNLQSWFHRGTLECRLHAGTLNYRKITSWLRLWINIHDLAMKLKESDIVSLPVGWETLLRCAPTEDVKLWLQQRRETFEGSISQLSFDPEQQINRARLAH